MTRSMVHRLTLVVLVAGLAGMVLPAAAAAEAAGNFLKAMEGSYRGKGTARLFGRESEENLVCQVDNRFDAGAKALIVSGNCASTQAKSAVSGKLSYSGSNVSGALIGSFEGATITKSVGTVSGGQLVVTTNLVDNTTGNLTRTRQVIELSQRGFVARFFTYDNAKARFELSGSMAFSRS